jgi:hypothetical protein
LRQLEVNQLLDIVLLKSAISQVLSVLCVDQQLPIFAHPRLAALSSCDLLTQDDAAVPAAAGAFH